MEINGDDKEENGDSKGNKGHDEGGNKEAGGVSMYPS